MADETLGDGRRAMGGRAAADLAAGVVIMQMRDPWLMVRSGECGDQIRGQRGLTRGSTDPGCRLIRMWIVEMSVTLKRVPGGLNRAEPGWTGLNRVEPGW